MSRLVVGLVAGVAAVSFLAARSWLDLREVNTQAAQLRQRVAELQTTRPAALPASGVASATVAVAPAVPLVSTAVPEAPASGSKKDGTLIDAVTAVFETEEGKAVMLARSRMMLPRMYPGVAKELKLTGAEEDRFFDLLARQRTESAAANAAEQTAPRGDAAATAERRREDSKRFQANQAEMTALLGSRVSQWEAYQRSLPVRRQVEQLQNVLGANALSDAQSAPLIAAMAAERERIQQEGRFVPPAATQSVRQREEANLQREIDENRRLMAVASAHLNPQQIEAYQQMLREQEEMARVMMNAMVPQ